MNKRLIPDNECMQGKCACTTTGCWGECSMKKHPFNVQFSVEADRNKRAKPVALTDEQRTKIEEAIKTTEYKYFGDYEFTDGQHEAVDVLVNAARSLLASTQQVAPKEVRDGFVLVPVTLLEWAQQNIDNVEDEDERERVSASLGDYIADAAPTTAELPQPDSPEK